MCASSRSWAPGWGIARVWGFRIENLELLGVGKASG